VSAVLSQVEALRKELSDAKVAAEEASGRAAALAESNAKAKAEAEPAAAAARASLAAAQSQRDVLASRLAVVVPFHMINVAAGIMSVRLTPYTVATVIGLLPAHIIYCWIGARLNELLRTNPNPDFQALFGQFWAPMAGVFVLAVVLPFALKGLQAALGRKAAT
jgi:uncharacterized membrane protein YdjX (TVP38/TMEM64 family)